MALKIPRHRLDHEPQLVSAQDSSWNSDLIRSEKAAQPEAHHPVDYYLEGRNRYDLHAQVRYGDKLASAADYLNGGDYTIFKLRRLGSSERAKIQDMQLGKQYFQSMRELARIGVFEIVRGGDLKHEPGGYLDEAMLSRLEAVEGGTGCSGEAVSNLLHEVAGAVWALSEPLTAAEKKA